MFFKYTLADRLIKIAINTQLKNWNKIIKQIKTQAYINAKKGDIKLVIYENDIKCDYNKTRTLEEIIEDLKKAFTGCNINYGKNLSNTLIIEIKWKNNLTT